MGNYNQYGLAGINVSAALCFDDQDIEEINGESKWMRVCLCSTVVTARQ